MKIAIGSDHAGFELKNKIRDYLLEKNIEVIDFGCDSSASTDYPIYGKKVAKSVANNEAEKGIVICYTGIGISIVANKEKNIRCALVRSKDEAFLTRSHNDANVVALGAKYTPFELAKEIVDVFLETPFSNLEKHQRRINEIEV